MSSLIRLVDVMKRWSLDGVETLKGFPWAYPMSESLVNVAYAILHASYPIICTIDELGS